MPSRVASGLPPSESTWTVSGSDRRLAGSTSRLAEAGRGHAPVLGVGREVGAGEPPHPGEDAGRVGEARIAQRVDDAVEPVDDLPLAPTGRERRRRDRDRRHRRGLDGDQGDQDLVADGPPHRTCPAPSAGAPRLSSRRSLLPIRPSRRLASQGLLGPLPRRPAPQTRNLDEFRKSVACLSPRSRYPPIEEPLGPVESMRERALED